MKPVAFLPEAEQEMLEAARYYESQATSNVLKPTQSGQSKWPVSVNQPTSLTKQTKKRNKPDKRDKPIQPIEPIKLNVGFRGKIPLAIPRVLSKNKDDLHFYNLDGIRFPGD